MDAQITININGREQTVTTDPARTLLDVLREDLQLTGTKYGCGEGRCGACSVLVDGRRMFSCRTEVEDVVGKAITTIEGLADGDKLHPVQEAFLAGAASQCGYCTPGMIMAAVALTRDKPGASEAEMVSWMNGNLCRCCNYVNILGAVRRACAAGRGEAK